MPRKQTTNLVLMGFDDIFKVSTNNMNLTGEKIVSIPLTALYPPELHPFQASDDDAMKRLVESVKQYGIREPGLARPRFDGGYELLCGNRRKRACEIADITEMPVIIRELDDDTAILTMIDSNLEQREKILPSEKAQAFRMMMETLNHNGVKGESHSYEIMVERTGVKKNQLFRIIRLTELIVPLIDKVDANQLAFNPAVELSYLSQLEQTAVVTAIEEYEIKPSLAQAVQLKKMKQDGKLTDGLINDILSKNKSQLNGENKGTNKYQHFFPVNFSPKQIDDVIVKLLTEWKAGYAV